MTCAEFAEILGRFTKNPAFVKELPDITLHSVYGICKTMADWADKELRERAKRNMSVVKTDKSNIRVVK